MTTSMPGIDRTLATIERPQSALLVYYFLRSLLLGPLFPLLFIPLYFRYHTLRYDCDDQGISMRWGILFRREINLTYARIQDMHLRSNIVERWLGLARLQIQTASGSAEAEMVLEGLEQVEHVRDCLYLEMRGGKLPQASGSTVGAPAPRDDLADILRECAQEIHLLREQLAAGRPPGGTGA